MKSTVEPVFSNFVIYLIYKTERMNNIIKKKFVALFLSTAICLTTAGCSVSIPGIGSNVSSASDVIEKYVENMEGSCNYHTDMDMEIGISADAQGMKIDLPIELSLSADVLDGDMHGDMNMSMSFMGQDMDQSMEMYVESGKHGSTMYTYDSEFGYWMMSEDDKNAEAALSFGGLDPDDFEDAKMEYDKDKKAYTVTQEFGDFVDSNSVYDMIGEMYDDMSGMMSMDYNDILDAWEDAEVIYVFDKDFYLSSVTVDGCEYSGTMSEDGTDVDLTVTLDLEVKFSDYGEIEDSDVEVPKKVKKDAITSLPFDTEDGGLDENGNPLFGNQDHICDGGLDKDGNPLFGNQDESFGGYDDDDAFSYPEASKPEIGVTTPEEMHGRTDIDDPGLTTQGFPATAELGAYKGIGLTAFGDSWDETFGADGWSFANDDGEYSFMSAENPKYKDAILYVYNFSRENTTHAEIMDNGFYGYSIDCAFSSTYPDMTWNGLTFGASAEDIFGCYGNPDDSYTGNMYTMYQYDIGNNIEMEFYVYPDKGLQRVMVSNFNGIHN